jgi:hypothetical protein
MPINYPRQKPGAFGRQLIALQVGPIGPADYLGGAAPLTVNDTTIFRGGAVPVRCRFLKLGASQTTVVADADGTVLARAMKYDAGDDAATAVSSDIDLEAGTAREQQTAGQLSTATEATLTFDAGDTLEINVVNNSAAINTQPAGLVFVALFEVLE